MKKLSYVYGLKHSYWNSAMIFGEIDAALNLWERLRNMCRNLIKPPIESVATESVATRFVFLFESHGVHRNQIPRYFGHGIKLQDLRDDDLLLTKLEESALNAACMHFAVRREWLDGADPQAHPCHDFYGRTEEFVDLIKTLKANNPEGQWRGVLVTPIEMDWKAYALLILQEQIGSIGEKPIYRYHLCNNWAFSYWKARAYLAACIASAWNQEIFVQGIYASREIIEELANGQTLLGWQGEGIPTFGGKRWYPEDMALMPDAFLYGVNPEQGNYGITSGLKLWLELDQQGLMDTGLNKSVRQLFQQELAKYGEKLQL